MAFANDPPLAEVDACDLGLSTFLCVHAFTHSQSTHSCTQVPHSYIQSKHFAGIAVMKKGEKQAKSHQTNKHTTGNKQAKTS